MQKVRTHPPRNLASGKTETSHMKLHPCLTSSLPHGTFPTSLLFLQERFYHNCLDRNSSLKVCVWKTGSKSSRKSQSLETTSLDLTNDTPGVVALQQLIFYILGLSLFRTPRSLLMISPLHVLFSPHLSYPN